jgi:NAD(P)-dependent dehydrogenase (short-subunit alcohol dehydrogenase family)
VSAAVSGPKRPLAGEVAVVTGARRGVGKGIALGLGDAGATVYVTGRSILAGPVPGTIDETAREVTARGGRGVAVRCDHAADAEVEALFRRVRDDEGRLDVLVNNAFAIPEGRIRGPFWELPIAQWDAMHAVGLRSHYAERPSAGEDGGALWLEEEGHRPGRGHGTRIRPVTGWRRLGLTARSGPSRGRRRARCRSSRRG